MKNIIVISGVLGGLLLLFRLIGIISEFVYNDLLLVSGLFLVVVVFIPLSIVDRVRQNRKINDIIDSYKGSGKNKEKLAVGDKVTKGWGMNNSPFRDRKSSASWGGGNIKGASVTRSSRKSFLK